MAPPPPSQTGTAIRRLAARIVGHALVLIARFITAVRADWRGVAATCQSSARLLRQSHVECRSAHALGRHAARTCGARSAPWPRRTTGCKIRSGPSWGRRSSTPCSWTAAPTSAPKTRWRSILAALDEGASLIIFPEGGRNRTEDPLLPFKAGLYNIAKARPEVDLVPAWIANLNEIMPSGEVIPLPLICTVTFRRAAPCGAGRRQGRVSGPRGGCACRRSGHRPPSD